MQGEEGAEGFFSLLLGKGGGRKGALVVVHQVAGGVVLYQAALFQLYGDFDEVRVTEGFLLPDGCGGVEIDGKDTVVF